MRLHRNTLYPAFNGFWPILKVILGHFDNLYLGPVGYLKTVTKIYVIESLLISKCAKFHSRFLSPKWAQL